MKVEFIQSVGKDSGKPYHALRVYITDEVIKLVFLSPAETQLLLLSGHKPKVV
ncbi:hypothetical protein [Erysipelothrix aquatica]|uniref:hypothetical protein n=1 Tax=Erysipelothrix aquatica TaxID=2683714 RepID=UPI00135B1304|nr:hypothetical protein [Erysipelothrix aquatica]